MFFDNLLTPAALAHWIMGDGTKHGNGLELCTAALAANWGYY